MSNALSTCHDAELIGRVRSIRQQDSRLQLFGLIDGTVDDDNLEQFFLQAPEADYEPLFLGTDYEPCLPYSPYLVLLNQSSEGFLEQWGQWSEHGIIWWLSPLTLPEQAEFWRSLLQAILPTGETAVFRYWNAQVLRPYLHTCSPAERQQLLAPCHTLLMPDKHRQWQCWSIGGGTLLSQESLPWWQIHPSHLAAFASNFDQVLADQIEDELWRIEPERLQHIYPAIIRNWIRLGIEQARSLRLTRDDSLLRFIQCQLHFGFEYWQHPELKPLWLEDKHNESAFLDWSARQLAQQS